MTGRQAGAGSVMRKWFAALAALALPFALVPAAGCLSLMEKTGRALDGSAFAEKETARYRSLKREGAVEDLELSERRDRADERSFLVSLNRLPVMKLRASPPDGEGGFFLTSLEYLGSSAAGWNEYTLDISGTGTLVLGETEAVLSVPRPPDAVGISRGRIHRYDTRITGTEALTNLRNRRERILALTGWMASREDAPAGLDRKGFEKYWKPILFPEMVRGGKRPPEWRRETARWAWAEDIRWNLDYTARVFPEELRAVRNSGTLLRDWEEAPGWIYLEYEWERIFAPLSGGITLRRYK